MDNPELGDKIEDEDKAKLTEAMDEATKWLETHQEASAEEYEAKQKELEGVIHPIMVKVYSQATNSGNAESDDVQAN